MMSYFKLTVMAFALMIPAIAGADGNDNGLPGWMTGAWASQDGERWSDEYWTPPRGGIMIGAARIGVVGPEPGHLLHGLLGGVDMAPGPVIHLIEPDPVIAPFPPGSPPRVLTNPILMR